MNLPPYLFIPSQSFLQGGGFILKTTAPYILGKLYLCDNIEDIERMQSKIGNKQFAKMEGYNIFITHFTNLPDTTESTAPLQEMLAYYRDEIIDKRAGKYKRFLR